MIALMALSVFSGLSLNLLLSFGLGAAGVTADAQGENRRQLPFFQLGVLFLAVLFLWLVFSHVVPPAWRGFSLFFLFFPFSALVCLGLELLSEHFFPKAGKIIKVYSALTAYEGLVPASLFITFSLAGSFAGAVVLSLFFALGNLIAMLLLNEIRRRSTLEWVPRHLRGSPLVLVSMGLLSLISASAAGICFKMLEVFR